jgi:hypothetical protein
VKIAKKSIAITWCGIDRLVWGIKSLLCLGVSFYAQHHVAFLLKDSDSNYMCCAAGSLLESEKESTFDVC